MQLPDLIHTQTYIRPKIFHPTKATETGILQHQQTKEILLVDSESEILGPKQSCNPCEIKMNQINKQHL